MESSLGEATLPACELLQVVRRELGKELQAPVVSRVVCLTCCVSLLLAAAPEVETMAGHLQLLL